MILFSYISDNDFTLSHSFLSPFLFLTAKYPQRMDQYNKWNGETKDDAHNHAAQILAMHNQNFCQRLRL